MSASFHARVIADVEVYEREVYDCEREVSHRIVGGPRPYGDLRNHVGTGHALLRKADVNGYGKTGESEH